MEAIALLLWTIEVVVASGISIASNLVAVVDAVAIAVRCIGVKTVFQFFAHCQPVAIKVEV
ncbi:hypothetical protein C7B79_30400 [Chroococcidiopsis cubana CCALA 043]|nr:hypothetical protein C7B79_30400 [Chroococcidiopsis cubana CCALA 043]